MTRMQRWAVAQVRPLPPRRVVVALGAIGVVVSVFVVLMQVAGLDDGSVRVVFPGRWSGGTLLGEVPAVPALISALPLPVAACIWIVGVAVLHRRSAWLIVGVPTVAVAVHYGTNAVLLALDPQTSGWGVAGGVLVLVLATGLVALVNLGAWATLHRDSGPSTAQPDGSAS